MRLYICFYEYMSILINLPFLAPIIYTESIISYCFIGSFVFVSVKVCERNKSDSLLILFANTD